jgi:hypothetical protein
MATIQEKLNKLYNEEKETGVPVETLLRNLALNSLMNQYRAHLGLSPIIDHKVISYALAEMEV